MTIHRGFGFCLAQSMNAEGGSGLDGWSLRRAAATHHNHERLDSGARSEGRNAIQARQLERLAVVPEQSSCGQILAVFCRSIPLTR